MQQEILTTTYQDEYQWPTSMPNKNKQMEEKMLMAAHPAARPKTSPQKNLVPEVCMEFAQTFDCKCKNQSGGSKKKNSEQSNCVHVNVFMPYQVNFNNVPADKKKELNTYIYNSERKEALQAGAMKCTQHPPYSMKDINKKVDIKLRPKTAPNNKKDCNQNQKVNNNKEPLCLTMEELKNLAEIAKSDGFRKTFEQPPNYKGHKPKNFCNCVKPERK